MRTSHSIVSLLTLLTLLFGIAGCQNQNKAPLYSGDAFVKHISLEVIARADSFVTLDPITVTASSCPRSSGGIHDFYSEGDYWWPDPTNPDGPYIQRDGQSNPDNFSDHRHAMVRLSEITSTLTSAWLLTGNSQYASRALKHINAWFVDTATSMRPNMLYAQAIFNKVTGRGIGLIDAYHLVEVAQSAKILIDNSFVTNENSEQIKGWFNNFLTWMTTHPYGVAELNAENNHGTCWVATASSMAVLTGNKEIIQFCTDRFKDVLLPDQMASDGSFPRELRRTKPYGYSLFNIDAMCNVAWILSTPDNNLFNFETDSGQCIQKGMDFIFPYIAYKSLWPFKKDIYIWDEWPVRQSCLLFAGMAFKNQAYLSEYLNLPSHPHHPEVIRNLPVRHPAIWLLQKPLN